MTAESTDRASRIPPFSEEAERGLLGSVLLDDRRVYDICTRYRIVTESFYVPAHREVWEVIEGLVNRAKCVDALTVGEVLRRIGRIESIGGGSYLDKLIESTPTTAHAEYYIEIVAQKARLRAVIDQCRQTEQSCFEQENTVDEILAEHDGGLASIERTYAQQEEDWPDTLKSTVEGIESVITSKRTPGLPTGFANIDRSTLGLKPQELIILAARPSMGKTSLAMNIATHVAMGETENQDGPQPVGIFSLEMSREALAQRMICARARVNLWQIMRGFGKPDDHQKMIAAASQLREAIIKIDDAGGLDIHQVRNRARRWKEKYNVALIVVDYLTLLHDRSVAKQGRQNEVASISGNLKDMAKELKIPVLVLAQLSRLVEQKDREGRPRLSDLRDSGAIEQDADLVLLMRRPSKLRDDEEKKDTTLAIVEVAKQRSGPTGEIRLNFEEEYTLFTDRARTGEMLQEEEQDQQELL